MGFATPNVEDHTLLATIAAKPNATTTSPVLRAPIAAKSVALIRNVASCATNLVFPAQKTVPGLALTGDNAPCLVQSLATFCHAQSAVERNMIVDFIMSSTFEEVDLDESPCIIPPCGHILTLESMDGHMSMSDFYTMDAEGSIVGLKNNAEPFSASGMKSCPTCRGPLRTLNRYSRIVRRALIDEATKKFIVWANMNFVPLVARMQEIEGNLRESTEGPQQTTRGVLPEGSSPGPLHLRGTRDQQFSQVAKLMQNINKHSLVLRLRNEVKKFLGQVDEGEQPFGRIYDLAQDARRHRGVDVNLDAKVDILQVRNRLLTTVLLIRCDYTILSTFLNDRKGATQAADHGVKIDLSINRKDCEKLIAESLSRDQPAVTVEGHLYWARFFALERSFADPTSALTQLLDEAREHLTLARRICVAHLGQTAGMQEEVNDVEKMLRGSTFYLPVSNDEKAAVYAAMAQGFSGTGHWYYCENNHPFTVGECGMPMQTSRCPQCGSPVGGQNHQSVGGVTRATDLEQQFAGLGI
ncbi:E3 ubiquitin-protein ligase rnf213-alpha [Lachnellula subtilissima]|uniref:E3 ubiquitin-protein ligase rnf213-alpha n=1 Tax=Lachnellula subtilissima TaxID=602034 RepID=A0A8H8S001_9HELO|nr:E3 ubiquitin-protein ligase rnf213-alpha [Lachnellula subtilissima]